MRRTTAVTVGLFAILTTAAACFDVGAPIETELCNCLVDEFAEYGGAGVEQCESLFRGRLNVAEEEQRAAFLDFFEENCSGLTCGPCVGVGAPAPLCAPTGNDCVLSSECCAPADRCQSTSGSVGKCTACLGLGTPCSTGSCCNGLVCEALSQSCIAAP